MKGDSSLPKLIGFSAAMAAALALTGCDPGISITYENRTDSTVRVDVRTSDDQQPVFDEVEAGLTRTIDYLADDTYEFTVVTEDGRVLFHEVLTEDELGERGNRIVIEELSSRRPVVPEATLALPP